MRIIYTTTDLQEKEITLENAVDIQVNGISIVETNEGLMLTFPRGHIIKTVCENNISISKR